MFKATSSNIEKCGNDHGKWLPFNELHKGEFIRKMKFLNAQRVCSNHGVIIESNEKEFVPSYTIILSR